MVAATLALVLPIANWGIPHVNADLRAHAWGNDDQVPLAPLAELHNALVEARSDRNVAYPMFHYLLLGGAYAPYLAALKLGGDLERPSGDIFGMTQNAGMGWDPARLNGAEFLLLSTHGGIRAEDGTPIALGYHTGHWEVGLLVKAAA